MSGEKAPDMKFDIARQPLVPAFLTLAALAVVAMWNAGGPAVSMAVQAGHAARNRRYRPECRRRTCGLFPGELLAQFPGPHIPSGRAGSPDC